MRAKKYALNSLLPVDDIAFYDKQKNFDASVHFYTAPNIVFIGLMIK